MQAIVKGSDTITNLQCFDFTLATFGDDQRAKRETSDPFDRAETNAFGRITALIVKLINRSV
ncbi:hypothetical protein [Octadecabacter antarcticus]|uniref:hypothetical protein n=1 Tax=Octadecabacter antarcticus TaxID=1217908 RepID=UPI00018066D2|nr:hypothetical protein [Octadecabacter antarcticus]